MFSLNLGEMEEFPIEFPSSQLYVYDWSLWMNDIKKRKESFMVHAYNLIQIIIVKVLKFFYTVMFFYFIPFTIVGFVQVYGIRTISIDTKTILAEKHNKGLTLTEIHEFWDFGANSTFMAYY